MQQDIKKFPESLPDRYNLLEKGIDLQTQQEYIDYSHSFGHGELTESQTLKLGEILFDARIDLTGRKKALALLAHLGTITAFRQIEKYYQNPDNELKQWAALALQECKMFLMSELSDESVVFISGGLGGEPDKMRYYLLVLPSTDQDFTSTQKSIIKEEFILAAKDLNCVAETFDLSDSYAGMTALVPLDVAVGNFIDTGIKKCNELGKFVLEDYYVTNQDIPEPAEIPEIIAKVKE